MALAPYLSSSKPTPTGPTEFDVLRASHKFLRDEDENASTWEDQVAKKYYENLYREFAVCDLKHYKTGNFALRWRTESEVLAGVGEESCGNTRCQHHTLPRAGAAEVPPKLKTVELPFAYEEDGEVKQALVKMVLCDKCVKKIMWKREKEQEVEKERHVQEQLPEAAKQSIPLDDAYAEGSQRERRRRSETKDGEHEGIENLGRSRRTRRSRSRERSQGPRARRGRREEHRAHSKSRTTERRKDRSRSRSPRRRRGHVEP